MGDQRLHPDGPQDQNDHEHSRGDLRGGMGALGVWTLSPDGYGQCAAGEMTNPNEPAFPHEGATLGVANEIKDLVLKNPEFESKLIAITAKYSGLTKREYFAAMAMQGILFWDATVNENHETGKVETLAQQAVGMADALIAELSK